LAHSNVDGFIARLPTKFARMTNAARCRTRRFLASSCRAAQWRRGWHGDMLDGLGFVRGSSGWLPPCGPGARCWSAQGCRQRYRARATRWCVAQLAVHDTDGAKTKGR